MPKKPLNRNLCLDGATKERYDSLLESLKKLIQAKTKDEALKITVEEISNFINAEGTSVWLVDNEDEKMLKLAKTYTSEERVKINQSYYTALKDKDNKHDGLTGYIFAKGEPLRIKNIRNKKEIESISKELKWSDKYEGWKSGKKENVRPFLGVPIFSVKERKKVIGVVRIATTRDRKPFKELDQRLAEIFASILSFKLESFERKIMELDLFISLCDYKSDHDGVPTIEDIMYRGVEKFTSIFAGSHCSILTKEKDGRFYLKVSSRQKLMKRVKSGELHDVSYSAGEGKTGKIIETKKAILEKGNADIPLRSQKDEKSCEIDKPATSFIGAPIFDISTNDLIGVIRSAKHSQDPDYDFDDADKELLDHFAKQLSFIITFYKNMVRKDILGILHGFMSKNERKNVLDKYRTPQKPDPDQITIMFVDMKSFTNFCNSVFAIDAEKIITFLNLYFEEMGKIISKYQGVINAIKGDEFLAVFNGFKSCVQHRKMAIQAACAICEEFFTKFQEKFAQVFEEKFGELPLNDLFQNTNLGIKVGINTVKNVVVGALGPEGSQTLTITGQDVNLASRLITDIADNYKDDLKTILCFSSTYNHPEAENIVKAEPFYTLIRGGGGGLIKYKIFKIRQETIKYI